MSLLANQLANSIIQKKKKNQPCQLELNLIQPDPLQFYSQTDLNPPCKLRSGVDLLSFLTCGLGLDTHYQPN